MRRFLAALLTALLALGPSFAFAQDASEGGESGDQVDPADQLVTPTDAQQDYNDQGVVLIQDGKYKQAIASFRSSLSLGELNITYLNLGRAYFRLDRCLEAREAYDAAKTSPKVKAPTPAEIMDILNRFESEYSEACSATIAISCEDDPMVKVGDQPARSCSEVSAWPVTPGDYEVVASYDTGDVTKAVTVEGRSAAAVAFEKPEAVVEEQVVNGPAPAVEQGTPVYVWAILGTGLALAATAVVWDQVVTANKIDEYENSTDPANIPLESELKNDIQTNQSVTLAFAGASAAVLATGLVLWLLSGSDEPVEEGGVSAWMGEDSGGLVFSGRF